jgi:PAS domain S-box-containing protein
MKHPIDTAAPAAATVHVHALRGTELPDGSADGSFERLARLASRLLNAPIALIGLVDSGRSYYRSCVGLPEPWASRGELPLSHTLCQHTVASRAALVIDDARAHPLLAASAAIDELGIVAYAGIPLVTLDDRVVGSFCVMDHRPRHWTDEQIEVLRELAGSAVSEIRLQEAEDAARNRVEAEAAVHRQFEELVQGLDAVVWERDVATSQFTFVSQRAEATLGYPIHRWLEEPTFWQDVLLHPEDREWALSFCVTATQEGRDHELAYRAVRANGGTVWLRDFVRVVRDESGVPRQLRGVLVDVTKEWQARDELQKREAQLAEAQAVARLGSWEWDIESDTLSWSDEAYRLVGLEPQSVQPTLDLLLQLVHPEDRETVQTAVSGAQQHGERYCVEARLVLADGSIRHAQMRGEAVVDPRGRVVRLRGTGQDITDRVGTEEALRASEESYRAIFEASGDAIYVLDRDTGAILDVNRAACELNGFSAEEMKRLGIGGLSQHRPPYSWQDAQELIRRAAGGEPQRVDWLARHSSGRDVWGEVTLQRVNIGGEDRVLATARDVTQRRAAEAARRSAEQDAQAMAKRMRAVAGAAEGVIGAESVDVLQVVLREKCREVIAFDAFTLALYNQAEHTLAYLEGYDADLAIPAVVVPIDGTPGERAIRSRRSLLTRRSDDPDAVGALPMGTGRRSESIIRTPIRSGDRVLGLISVQSYTPELYTEPDVEVLEAIASLAATALLNLELLGELRASEESYRTIFDASNDAIYIHDLDTGALLDVNRRCYEMHGYSREELLALGVEGVADGTPPFDGAHAAAYLGRAAAGEPQRFEWLARRKDGGAVWGDVYLQRVTILGQDRILATVRDITERKMVDEQLHRLNEELEQRVTQRTVELARRTEELEAIFRALPDLYFRADAEGIIRDCRSGSGEELEPPPEVLLNRPLTEVLPPELSEQFTDALAELRRTGELVCLEYQLLFPDGAREYEARMLPLEDGSFIAVVRNITDRKQAERELQRREEHFRRITENAHDLVAVLDTDNTVLYVSPSVERMLGYAPEELVGKEGVITVHPEDAAIGDASFAAVLAQPGHTAVAEYRLRHKDGSWRVVEAFGRTLSPTSVDEGIVVNARDVTERKQFEAALQEREEHFRSLIENALDMVQVLDVTGRTVYISPSVQRILGYSPEELIGRLMLDLVHPEDRRRGEATLGQLASDPASSAAGDFRLRHRDGSYRLLESFGRFISPESPERGIVVNARDITERKQFEEALQEREEHFRRLIENSGDMIQLLDSTGRITYTGPSVERLLGYTPEEIRGTDALSYIHPEDVETTTAALMEMLARPDEVITAEYRVRHKAGHYRMFEAFSRTLFEPGGRQVVVVNARDVTVRREAEHALVRQREYFELLLASVDAGVSAWDPECRFEYVSSNAVPEADAREWIIGKTHAEYYAWAGKPSAVAAVRHHHVSQAIELRRATEYEEAMLRPDGSPAHMLRRFWPIIGEDGEVERVIGYSVDISERKHVEEALRHATEEAERARETAERANRAKSEFLSRMSHELRTPMNSILGFGQLLERATLPPEHRKGVGHILKAGRHLLQLINEVLEIARIEAGRHSLSLEPVRLGAVLQEAVGLVRPLAAQWRVELDEGPWPCCAAYVQADRQRLTQVLLNLLGNAIKYNRPGGRVRVSCESQGAGESERLVLRVQDTGRGIPTGRADQLFTPFARLGAEQSEVEGTGLGLALSQRLTEAMGGSLTLEHTGPEGSVFRLDLLIASDPLRQLEEASTLPPSLGDVPHAPATLLYIEDNLANLSLVETILLSRPHWRTLPALQGLVGMELAREHKPDLILLDLHLPDIQGEEVLRRLRAEPRTAGIPVIIITADATRSTADRLRAMGADAYLTKPLDVDEFLATVEPFLPAPE